jgi:hypothetical protein
MPSLNADPMLYSLNQLAGVLTGSEHDRVQVAIRARRAVLKRRRARGIRALARFLPHPR